MDNIKNDDYYLKKIISDLSFIVLHTKGKSKKEIEGNDILIDSIMFRIIQIGENTGKLSDKFKEANSNIPWIEVKGLRNRIVHDYGVVNFGIIYDTISIDIPEMLELLSNIC